MTISLATESYLMQSARWPATGRHILAQYDKNSIVVYQAYSASIGTFAAHNGYFGGAFSLRRMTWIKPNFLWMMYRSGWGTKPSQEVILAVRIWRTAFDSLLRCAVPSTFVPETYRTPAEWKDAMANSPIRLQWDPDHDPAYLPVKRRAIQLGISGVPLERYARDWIVNIEDISEFVAAQRPHAQARLDLLETPSETLYVPADVTTAARIGLHKDDR